MTQLSSRNAHQFLFHRVAELQRRNEQIAITILAG